MDVGLVDCDYLDRLNRYHLELQNAAALSAHLLDLTIELASEEWVQAACFMMRDRLPDLAENLPFPDRPAGLDRGDEDGQS
jgi:hypothetical protein